MSDPKGLSRSINEYREWRKSRHANVAAAGFQVDPATLHPKLRPDQRAIVDWSLRLGRAGLFANTGCGKTFDELEWSRVIAERTNGKVLILAPLVVADQIVREANTKWNIPAVYVRHQEDADNAKESIVVSNYEIMDHFNPAKFSGIVGDEASFLKNSRGKYRHYFTKEFAPHAPYRLVATATPAPNELDELGNYSQALGHIPWHEMVTRFFIRDSNQADHLRLKGHAEEAFWQWVASWSVCMSKPSDLGFSDAGFDLPALKVHHEYVEIDHKKAWDTGRLMFTQALSATDLYENKHLTLDARMDRCAAIVATDDSQPWAIWVETNEEADALRARIPAAIEVRGSESFDEKRAKLRSFSDGNERILITKLDIAGFGMNWQHCSKVVFASLTYSFERTYQGIRRFWRYGQTRDVDVYLITASTEANVLQAVRRKEAQFATMQAQMNRAQSATGLLATHKLFEDYDYEPAQPMTVPAFIAQKEMISCL